LDLILQLSPGLLMITKQQWILQHFLLFQLLKKYLSGIHQIKTNIFEGIIYDSKSI
jgi:hypothetical protein